MKKFAATVFLLLPVLCLTVSAAPAANTPEITSNTFLKAAVFMLLPLSLSLVAVSVVLGVFLYRRQKQAHQDTHKLGLRVVSIITFVLTAIAVTAAVAVTYRYALLPETPSSAVNDNFSAPSDIQSAPENTEDVPPVVQVTEYSPTFTPAQTDSTNPKNWGVKWDIIKNNSIVSSYNRPEKIFFGKGSEYSSVQGITTFRGNNWRNGATFGNAKVQNRTLTEKWNKPISALKWTGCGWTGQPLVVRWDEQTKSIMNIYPEKKAKAGLVEAIYATLDGHIYFYDIDDGSYTRDPIWMGMNFKGAGTLDPRGYPLMYVGSGDVRDGKVPRMYIVSLIEGKIIYEQSGKESLIPRRGGWCAFDGAPLVSGAADTLIWPGESGIIYTIKLNTAYDMAAGTISVNPENIAKARYNTTLGRTLGFESSVLAVGEHLYVGDNGGMLFCFNVNTMKLVWAQNTRDDVNATPVFESTSDGGGYLYTATSMEYGGGNSYIYKLDAATGEIIWERTYSGILYDKGVSGGILGSPLLGKAGTPLEGVIVYPVGKIGNNTGKLVALNTATGETIWEKQMGTYTWSSPTAVYASDGNAYIIICSAGGTMYLLDSKTGETLSQVNLGSTVESSPVVFENTVIIGTRGQRVFGIEIS